VEAPRRGKLERVCVASDRRIETEKSGTAKIVRGPELIPKRVMFPPPRRLQG